MRGHLDLERAIVAAGLCAFLALVLPWEVVRLVLAVPLVLFLPGYAILAAAFGPRRLERPQLVVLSLGTSLATVALAGLLLDILPGGLRKATWALLLVIVVIAACRAAALRRPKPRRRPKRSPLPRPRRLDAILLAAAGVLAVAALALAQTVLPAGDARGYTALWMLPTDAGESAVEVGVASAEQDTTAYILRVKVGGRKQQISRFSLEPGEERTIEVPADGGSERVPVRVAASLYRQLQPQHLYRRVTSWLPGQRSLP